MRKITKNVHNRVGGQLGDCDIMEAKENVSLEEESGQQFPGMVCAAYHAHNWSLSGSCLLQPPPFLPSPQTHSLRCNTNLA